MLGLAAVVLVAGMALLVPNPAHAQVAESPYLNGVMPVKSGAGFVHPGVFVGLAQLEAVRRKIAEGQEPQSSIYRWMTGPANSGLVNRKAVWDVYSNAVDTSKPCRSRSSQGCAMAAGYSGASGREHTDLSKQNMSYQINSAYANALLYYYSGGEEKYAQNAIRMLNAYGHTFKGFASSPANSYVGDLFAAWMAQTLVRSAEIIRYTYTPSAGKKAFDVDAFEAMLRTAFVPRLETGTANINNWRTSAAEGLMNIGVFLDDRDIYNQALKIWRAETPSYIYLASDGPRPASLLRGTDAQLDCRWAHNYSASCRTTPKTLPGLVYQNGQSEEICRDMWHASAGVGGIINAAQTASLQGTDLYGEQRDRIMTGLSYMLELSQNVESKGYPTDFCAGAASYSEPGSDGETFPKEWDSTDPLSVVVAYNHYATEQGRSFSMIEIPGYAGLPKNTDPVAAYIRGNRSGPHDTYGFVTAWQVLTYYGVGSGVPPTAAPYVPKPSSATSSGTNPTPTASSGAAVPKANSAAPAGVAEAAVLLLSGLAALAIGAGALLLIGKRMRRR